MKKGKLNKFKYKFYVPLFIFPVITVINNFLLYSSNFGGFLDSINDDVRYTITSFLSILSIGACCYIFIYYQGLLERDNNIKDLETTEANIFLDIDSLCARKGNATKVSNVAKDENPVHKSMESLVQELIGERLLTLSQYVTLDTAGKILRLDKTTLTNDGYQLILH